ncbi:PREDICTED: angiopoietin-related protein 4 [Nipponia nippon]|uniref:angiopoietin-related protein 4 n=1 Tax=Nipponia nippon TaxID=128390 RepID=UPI0005110D99|nr:PREDICTED: angiopoietin-related protein 4 [Nipponia nippon]
MQDKAWQEMAGNEMGAWFSQEPGVGTLEESQGAAAVAHGDLPGFGLLARSQLSRVPITCGVTRRRCRLDADGRHPGLITPSRPSVPSPSPAPGLYRTARAPCHPLSLRPLAQATLPTPSRLGLLLEEPDPVRSLMDAQNLRIEELLQKIKQQQYKLDKQNLQIKSLQSKVNLLIPLHLKDNKTQSPKWKMNLKKSLSLTNQSQNTSGEPVLTQKLPEDCHQLFLAGQQSSGVFQVQPAGSQPFKVYCDMTAEGGWTVIQRRTDGSVDFDQLWDAYKNGFGDLRGDFWLGLEKMHHLVQEGRYDLLIELEDWEGNSQVVQFVFSLGGESTAYTLNLLGPLSGELENAIGDFRQLPFSTRDRDHDLKADTNCAKHLSGGWWFSTCGHANLNGKYFRSIPRQRHERKQGIFWKTWKGRYYPLKSTTMKIQPAALEAEP